MHVEILRSKFFSRQQIKSYQKKFSSFAISSRSNLVTPRLIPSVPQVVIRCIARSNDILLPEIP